MYAALRLNDFDEERVIQRVTVVGDKPEENLRDGRLESKSAEVRDGAT